MKTDVAMFRLLLIRMWALFLRRWYYRTDIQHFYYESEARKASYQFERLRKETLQ